MKLKDLLKAIDHQGYKVMVQMDYNFPSIKIEEKDLAHYLDYPVLFITDDWIITVKGAKLV